MIRIGLIGAGNISATHARAIAEIAGTLGTAGTAGSDVARLTAVYGPTRERAEALAAAHGARAFPSIDAMFDAEALDMVVVGTPSGLHGAHASAALRRGAHVLVEKPLEVTVERVDALLADAARAGRTLGVIFQDRMKADVQALKKMIDAGTLGTIRLVRAQVPWWRPPEYYSQSRWRGTRALDGGGALINQAIHTVDLVRWLCGPVTRVFGRTATLCHAIEVEDTAVAVLEFAGGALGTLEASTCAYPGRPRRIEIAGSAGTAILDGDRLVTASSEPAQPAENAASPVVSDVSAHRDVIVDFIRAFQRGTSPSCNGPDGRRSVALIEAVYQSARDGVSVAVKGDNIQPCS